MGLGLKLRSSSFQGRCSYPLSHLLSCLVFILTQGLVLNLKYSCLTLVSICYQAQFLRSYRKEMKKKYRAWWYMPLTPALRRQRQRLVPVNLRPAWSTEWVLGQQGLHGKTLSQKRKKKKLNRGRQDMAGHSHTRLTRLAPGLLLKPFLIIQQLHPQTRCLFGDPSRACVCKVVWDKDGTDVVIVPWADDFGYLGWA